MTNAARTIKTPKGKRMSAPQYLALQQARITRSRNGCGPACEYGHFDCAAWENGPCSDELRAMTAIPDPTDG